MSEVNNPSVQLLERYLDVAARRERVVATNIANLDTPGYHTHDLDFGEALTAAMDGRLAALEPQEVGGLVARPDGNNVSMERESLLLAEAQLQFRAGIQLLRSQFQRMRQAITGGSSS
jgi:flagellar basal-body rod protein FlgB